MRGGGDAKIGGLGGGVIIKHLHFCYKLKPIINIKGVNMKNTLSLLRQLQADSLVLFVKVHNFHWNVKGSDFYQVHQATQGIYEGFASMFDDVAEHIVQCGEIPVVTLQEALEISKIKEVTKTSFHSKEVFADLIKDFEYLLENFNALSDAAESSKNKAIIAYADEQVAHLQKSLWMLRASHS